MENYNITPSAMTYEEELWDMWCFSPARTRHTAFLIAEGHHHMEAIKQGDIDFICHYRELGEPGDIIGNEIEVFEGYYERMYCQFMAEDIPGTLPETVYDRGLRILVENEPDTPMELAREFLALREPLISVKSARSFIDKMNWKPANTVKADESAKRSECKDPLESMDPEDVWRPVCDLAGFQTKKLLEDLEKAIMLGSFAETKDPDRLPRFLKELEEKFRGSGVSEAVARVAVTGFVEWAVENHSHIDHFCSGSEP
ncbi:hypothetical protein F5882DRAFT_385014 [Hyaloscypha sp. PMI_1271]|nr:hypothetical protein F5882DRAFT_385014 [Hyaloscypha sp. PMI_1271]